MYNRLIKVCETIDLKREISRLEFDQKSVETRTKAVLKSLMLRLSLITNVFLLRRGVFIDTNNYREPPTNISIRVINNLKQNGALNTPKADRE